jgi:hypothetical protein
VLDGRVAHTHTGHSHWISGNLPPTAGHRWAWSWLRAPFAHPHGKHAPRDANQRGDRAAHSSASAHAFVAGCSFSFVRVRYHREVCHHSCVPCSEPLSPDSTTRRRTNGQREGWSRVGVGGVGWYWSHAGTTTGGAAHASEMSIRIIINGLLALRAQCSDIRLFVSSCASLGGGSK